MYTQQSSAIQKYPEGKEKLCKSFFLYYIFDCKDRVIVVFLSYLCRCFRFFFLLVYTSIYCTYFLNRKYNDDDNDDENRRKLLSLLLFIYLFR